MSITFWLLTLFFSGAAEGSLGNSWEADPLAWAEHRYKLHVRFFSSDALQGRDTPSPGQQAAAHYIASWLAYHGISATFPDKDEPYFQPVALRKTQLDPQSVDLRIEGKGASVKWGWGDKVRFRLLNHGSMDKKASFVFAGYGISNENFDEYANVDVNDRWVIMMSGRPYGEGPLFSQESLEGSRTFAKVGAAMDAGALGVLLLDESYEVQNGAPRRAISLPDENNRRGSSFPLVMVPKSQWRALFGRYYDRFEKALETIRKEETPAGFQLKGRKLHLRASSSEADISSDNVIAVLPGHHPQLKDEYLVITAHYDHIGIRNGLIYNGADDNGSGTATLLLLAERLSKMKHDRSILLIWLTAEEYGLLGSKYFLKEPTVPLKNIVANINFDMIGRNPDQGMGVIPSNNQDVSTLNEILASVNQRPGLGLKLRTDQDRYHRRSDHYPFVQREIPAVFFFGGVHEDYHGPGDDWEKLSYANLSRLYQMFEAFALAVANHEERPRFTKRDQGEGAGNE